MDINGSHLPLACNNTLLPNTAGEAVSIPEVPSPTPTKEKRRRFIHIKQAARRGHTDQRLVVDDVEANVNYNDGGEHQFDSSLLQDVTNVAGVTGFNLPPPSMLIMVWNCRGLGRSVAVRALNELIRSNRPDVIFLSKTKLNDTTNFDSICKQLGFSMFHSVPAQGSSGGLLLCWRDYIQIDVLIDTPHLINCLVSPGISCTPWQLTLVYGPPIISHRYLFWDNLTKIGDTFNGAWLVAGDFNAILEQKDKIGGRPISSASSGGFHGMLDTNGLIDLGFYGHAYTWTNKRVGKKNIQECLDRAYFHRRLLHICLPFTLIINQS